MMREEEIVCAIINLEIMGMNAATLLSHVNGHADLLHKVIWFYEEPVLEGFEYRRL